MLQSPGRKVAEAPDLAMAELSPADALLVARFDYRELRETLEAVVSSMVASTKGLAEETEILPPAEPASGS
jgi:hypothetical protein